MQPRRQVDACYLVLDILRYFADPCFTVTPPALRKLPRNLRSWTPTCSGLSDGGASQASEHRCFHLIDRLQLTLLEVGSAR